MAISTGSICADSITAIQSQLNKYGMAIMSLDNLCFIFKRKYELDDDDIRTDFQDIIDWFEAESWASGYTVEADWRRQTITIRTPQNIGA